MLLTTIFLYALSAFQSGNTPDALFEIKRQGLRLEPAEQTVLLGNGVSMDVPINLRYDGKLIEGMKIKGELVGPAYATPLSIDADAKDLRILLEHNKFTQEGVYTLTNVRLVNTDDSVVEYAQPRNARIDALEEVLVTNVEVREMGQEDLAALGYIFNDDDYQAVEFTLSMVVGSVTVPVEIPVAYPKKVTSSFTPKVLKDPFGSAIEVKPMMKYAPTLNPSAGGALEVEPPEEEPEYFLSLLLIPGRFSYLKSHFNITSIAINTAPEGYNVVIDRLKAELILPNPTRHGLPVKLGNGVAPVQQVIHPGADGVTGTGDDRDRIYSGERASVEYVVTGEIRGMYDIQVRMTGEVELPSGTVNLTSIGSGTVFVRDPEYVLTMEHPDVVAVDETYDMTMHVTNVGDIVLSGMSIDLTTQNLVGTEVVGSSSLTLPDLQPDEEGSVTFTMKARETGKVMASYFKVQGAADKALNLVVGIGENGERLTQYVLAFPNEFDQYLPADLATDLKRYAKKLVDFSQMTSRELPVGVGNIDDVQRRGMFNQWAIATQSRAYGYDQQTATAQILSSLMRSYQEGFGVDALRRHIITQGATGFDLETRMGAEIEAAFAAYTDDAMLTFLAQENEDTPGLVLMVLDTADTVDLTITDNAGRSMNNSGLREIPFGGIFPLSATRSLIWVSGLEALPSIKLTNPDTQTPVNADVSFIFPQPGSFSRAAVTSQSITVSEAVEFLYDPDTERLNVLPQGEAPYNVDAAIVPVKPFELVSARQVDPRITAEADRYGRYVLFGFNKPVQLGSLAPVESHIFINGEDVVDAALQTDPRFIMVSSRMPLGPYKPISYRLENPTSWDGQSLGTQSGEVVASDWYVGVSVHGRVVDHAGSDLTGARILLWQKDVEGEKRSGGLLNDITQMFEQYGHDEFMMGFPYKVFAETTLDEDGNYAFDYVVFPPFADHNSPPPEKALRSFKIGVVLPDDRYEEREFWPRGAAQDLQADFAFSYLGTVTGTVADENGQPLPFAPVYAVNQVYADSGGVTVTDENGQYTIEGIEVGQIVVKSRKGNFLGINGGFLTMANSPLTVDVTVSTPTGTLFGKVTYLDEEGVEQPAADVFVGMVTNQSFETYMDEFSYGAMYTVGTRTLPDGTYILENVPARQGYFLANHPVFGLMQDFAFLTDGEQKELNFVYQGNFLKGGSFGGRVIDMAGNPVPGATISTEFFRMDSAVDGSFLLEKLPLGIIIPAAVTSADGTLYKNFEIFLDPENPDRLNQELVLESDILITGTLKDNDGIPIPYARIYTGYLEGTDFIHRMLAWTDFNGNWSTTVPSNQTGARYFVGENPPYLSYTETYVLPDQANNADLIQNPAQGLLVEVRDSQGTLVEAEVNVRYKQFDAFPNRVGLAYTATDRKRTTAGQAFFQHVNGPEIEVWAYSELLGMTKRQTIDISQPVGTVAVSFDQSDLATLYGRVLDTDGVTPAPAGTKVQAFINGVRAVTEVNEDGFYTFDSFTNADVPKPLILTAFTTETTPLRPNNLYVEDRLQIHNSLRYRHDMILKNTGALDVEVVHADGTPVDYAAVKIQYPGLQFINDEEGNEQVEVIWTEIEAQITPDIRTIQQPITAGPFNVKANSLGLVGTRAYSLPATGGNYSVTVRLEAPSSISGTFVDDLDAAIVNAEIQLLHHDKIQEQKLSGDEPTPGEFFFDLLPMGRTWTLFGRDPASNRKAHLDVRTTPYNPNPTVTLKLDPIAHLSGYVTDENGDILPGATVKLIRGKDVLMTGTDPTGLYQFTNLDLGEYQLTASRWDIPTVGTEYISLVTNGQAYQHNLQTAPTHTLDLTVRSPELTPQAGVLVTIINPRYADTAFTDENGVARFVHVPPGSYGVESEDPRTLALLNDRINIPADESASVSRTVTFDGWGSIAGQVTDTLGNKPDIPVLIMFKWFERNLEQHHSIYSDAYGQYLIGRVPLNQTVTMTAINQDTFESATEEILLTEHGVRLEKDLVFRADTYVRGYVVDSQGNEVPYARVGYNDPIPREVVADQVGAFYISNVLEGDTIFYAKEPNGPRAITQVVSIVQDSYGDLVPQDNLTFQLAGVSNLNGVIRFADNAVVRSGTVSLENSEGVAFTSGIFADGSYRFINLPLDTYTMRAYSSKYDIDALATHTVTLDTDGGSAQQDLSFQPDFEFTAQLTRIDGITAVPDGHVELWHRDKESKWRRIYYGKTNVDGYVAIQRVFPGNYRVHAYNDALDLVYTDAYVMPDSTPSLFPISLHSSLTLTGSFISSNGKNFSSGQVSVLQNDRVKSTYLGLDGSFQVSGFETGTATVSATLAGGWVTHTEQYTLVDGPNANVFQTVPVVTLDGRAIYLGDDDFGFRVGMEVNGIEREVGFDASGFFIVDELPTGVPVKLHLYHHLKHRVFELGPFNSDTDMGTFYLDGSGPVISFDQDGLVISSRPVTLSFTVGEDGVESDIDASKTRVWLNTHNISADFATTATSVSATYPYWPAWTVRGVNTIKIQMANTSGSVTTETFNFTAQQNGTVLLVDLQNNGPVTGEARLDQGSWVFTDAAGRAVLENVSGGLHAIKGKDSSSGGRLTIDVDDTYLTVVQPLQLGAFGGYIGTVRGLDNQPAAGVEVWIGGEREITDSNGKYNFDFTPLGDHHLLARNGLQLGYRKPPELLAHENIKPGIDIQLVGRGSITGVVDQSGIPIADATVQLKYTDRDMFMSQIPEFRPPASVTTDVDGNYRIDNVYTYAVQLLATDSLTQNTGLAQLTGPADGLTVTQDISLHPNATVTGIIEDSAGIPVADQSVVMYDKDLDLTFQAQTAANGSFQITDIPFQGINYLDLRVLNQAAGEFYRQELFSVNQENQDAGILRLVPNQAPTFDPVTKPAYWDPNNSFYIYNRTRDDLGIAQIELVLSGAYVDSKSWTWDQDFPASAGIGHSIPAQASLVEGTVNYTYTVTDMMGATHQDTGSFEIRYDAVGPTLAVTQPLEGASFVEGSSIQILVTATDDNGVSGVEILDLNGNALTEADTAAPFEFNLTAPGVDEDSPVTYVVQAVDGLGFTSTTVLNLVIQAVTTSGAPNLVVSAPLDGMPAPIGLASGLQIPVVASAEDPDGLQGYELVIENQVVASAPLFGTQAVIDTAYTVPPVQQQNTQLNVALRVYDLGGNVAVHSATLNGMDGDIITQDLTIYSYDSSYDNKTLIVDGATLTIDGSHSLTGLALVNGAVMTQTPTDNELGNQAETRLTVTGDILIDYGTLVSADSTGWPGGVEGENVGNHGGVGGGGTIDKLYGSVFQPTTAGSSGGGGALEFDAGNNTIWLMGDISASLKQPSVAADYKGSGGSIWLKAGSLKGPGNIRANGYRAGDRGYEENAAITYQYSGAGGRIALEADMVNHTGQVTAYGGLWGGPGTIYSRTPDAQKPDGFDDVIRIAKHPDSAHNGITALQGLPSIVVGTDAVFNDDIIDQNKEYDELDFPADLPLERFKGMKLYVNGLTYDIGSQTTDKIRSLPNADWTLTNGDVVHIGFEVDQIVVGDEAFLRLAGEVPRSPITLHKGAMGSENDILDLTSVPLTVIEKGLLRNIQLGDWTTDGSYTLELAETVIFNNLNHTTGSIYVLNQGTVKASALTVAAGAEVLTMDGYNGSMTLETTGAMTIEGVLRARTNGRELADLLTTGLSHGGMGDVDYAAHDTYGTFYRPVSQGSELRDLLEEEAGYAGGHIRLSFNQLTLNGSVDATPETGSGGSILLEGNILTGTGSIDASGTQTPVAGRAGGGGRVAVLVSDIAGYTGSVSAYGSPDNLGAAGAGTVFYRTTTWPLGNLVVDNNGTLTPDYSTPLPSLGDRIAEFVVTAGATVMQGTGFPDNLEGLYVRINGADILLAGNSETELYAASGYSFPAVNAGDAYYGVHKLDRLEVKGNAYLYSTDKFELGEPPIGDGRADLVTIGDSTDPEYTDKTLVFTEPKNLSSLTLINSHVTYEAGLQVGTVVLDTNSKLTYKDTVTATIVTVDGGVLEAAGTGAVFNAQSVDLTNNALWTVAGRDGSTASVPLIASISGLLNVATGSEIFTTGQNKGPGVDLVFGEFSGARGLGGYGLIDAGGTSNPIMGSYMYPSLPGNKDGGGAVKITAGSLNLDGGIHADGYSMGSGGSIWIEAPVITGSGFMRARPGSFSGSNHAGGGRIAVHYGSDDSFRNNITFSTNPNYPQTNWREIAGGGTLFFKSAAQTHGELIIDQRADLATDHTEYEKRFRLSGVAGPGELTLAIGDNDADPRVIQDLAWADIPPGLAGLHVRLNVSGTDYEARILDNTYNSITVDSDLPAVIPQNTRLEFVLRLDKLSLKNGGQFHFAGILATPVIERDKTLLSSVWARKIEGLSNPLIFQDESFRLTLDEGDLANTDVQVTNGTLFLDKPATFRDVTLVNAQLTHSHWSANHFITELYEPGLDLTLRNLVADANSGIDVSRKRYDTASEPNNNHGGMGSSSLTNDTFGSLFHPFTVGIGANAGGRAHVTAQSISGGSYLADGSFGSAGSIYLDADTLSGNITARAGMDANLVAGGGRVAVYYGNRDAANLITGATGSKSPGTVFLKDKSAAYGNLIIDNQGNPVTGVTDIPGFTDYLVPAGFSSQNDGGQAVLTFPNTFTNDLRDYYLIINGNENDRYRVISNQVNTASPSTMVVEGNPVIAVGDTLALRVVLEGFSLGTGCATTKVPVLDGVDPVIDNITVLSGLYNGEAVPGLPITVRVEASDGFGLSQAVADFGGEQSQNVPAPAPFSFSFTPTTLQAGTSVDVNVSVDDISGRNALSTLTVPVALEDTGLPVVTLISPAEPIQVNSLEDFDITVSAADNVGMQSLQFEFNGVIGDPIDYTVNDAAHTVTLTAPYITVDQSFNLKVTATDLVGNAYQAVYTIGVTAVPFLQHVPAPVSYYSFDDVDMDGVVVKDSMWRNPGVNQGAVREAVGKAGQALAFGDNTHVEIPNHKSLDITGNALTVQAWIKPSNLVFSEMVVKAPEIDGTPNVRYGFRYNPANDEVKFLTVSQGEVVNGPAAGGALAVDTWAMLTGVFDGTTARLYIDGELVAQTAVSAPLASSSGPLYIGGYALGNANWFHGVIDEVMVWDEALNVSQVRHLYERGQAGDTQLFNPPEPVTDLIAEADAASISLTWTASVDSLGNLDHYEIYKDGVYVSSTNTTGAVIGGLSAYTTYALEVRSVNASGTASIADIDVTTLPTDLSTLTDPVAYWPLNQRNLDAVGFFDLMNGHHGSYSGDISVATGKTGEAFVFGSGTHAAAVADNLAFDATTSLTVQAWVKPEPAMNSQALRVVGKNGTTLDNYAYALVLVDDKPRFMVNLDGSPGPDGPAASVALPSDRWTLLSGTFDGTTARLFINGNPAAEKAMSGSLIQTNGSLGLGSDTDNGGGLYRGGLDEIGLWSTALDPRHINILYHQGLQGGGTLIDGIDPVIGTITLSPLIEIGKLEPNRPFTITVDVTDNTAVATVTASLGGQSVSLTGSGPFTGQMTAPDVAVETVDTLTVTAFDYSGNRDDEMQAQTIAAPDIEAPVGTLVNPADGAQMPIYSQFTAEFTTSDNRLVSALEVTFNGETQSLQIAADEQATQKSFSFAMPSAAGDYSLSWTVTDYAGNQSTVQSATLTALPIESADMPKPVSYWTFDDKVPDLEVANLASDLVGGNHVVSYNGNSFAGGRIGYRTDGIDDVAFVDDLSPNLELDNQLTLSAWVYIDAFNEDGGIITYGSAYADSPVEKYALVTTGDNRVAFRTNRGVDRQTVESGILAVDTWYHVVATFKDGHAEIYVNGLLDNETDWTVTDLPDDARLSGVAQTMRLSFGHHHAGANGYYEGILDDVMIFDSALTGPYIRRLYDSASGAPLDMRPPEDVTDVSVAATATSLDLVWTGSANTQVDLTGYRVTVNGVPTQTPGPAAGGALLNNLTANTNYEIVISALDNNGNESYGNRLYLATPPTAPGDFPNPVSYWTFDNTDKIGSVLKDRMGRNDLSITGFPNTTAGLVGDGMDITTQYLAAETPDGLDSRQTLTISTWINPFSYLSDSTAIYFGDASTQTYSIAIKGKTQFRFEAGQPTTPELSRVDPPSPKLRWHHIAAVFENGTARIYRNGKLHNEKAFSFNELPAAASPRFLIGISDLDVSSLHSTLDETMVWDSALTTTQIRQIYTLNRSGENLIDGAIDFNAPQAVTNLSAAPAHNAGQHSLAVSWTPPADGDLSHFEVRVNSVFEADVPAGTNNYLVAGLAEYTGYTIAVTPVDLAGNMGPTQTIVQTTLDVTNPTILTKTTDPISPEAGSAFTLTVTASDNVGFGSAEVVFNGQTTAGTETVAGTFEFSLTAPVNPAVNPMTADITVTDSSGNNAVDSLSIDIDVSAGEVSVPTPVNYHTFDPADKIVSGLLQYPFDVVGGNHANYHLGAINQAGKIGESFYFNGSNSAVGLAKVSPELDLAETLTLSAWVKITGFNEDGPIMSYGTKTFEAYSLVTTSSGRVSFRSNGHATRQTVDSNSLSTNTWYFVTAIFNNGQAQLYVNGQLHNSATWAATLPVNSDGFMFFGRHLWAGKYLNGNVDEAMTFDQALDANQVQLLYDGMNGVTTLDLRPPEEAGDPTFTLTPTSIGVNWTGSADSAGDLSGYKVFVNGNPVADLSTVATSYDITGLTENTDYEVRVAAVDTSGNASYGPRFWMATPPSDGATYPKPVSYWPMEDTHGNFTDTYGQNDLTPSFVYSVSSRTGFGKAARLLDSSYMRKTNPVDLDNRRTFTFSTWLYPQKKPIATYWGLLYLGNNTTESYSIRYVRDHLWYQFQGNEGSATRSATARAYNELNNWYHLAVTFDNGLLKIYLDGRLMETVTAGVTEFAAAASAFWQLGRKPSQTYGFEGYMDDVAFWNSSLTETQVRQLFTTGMAGMDSKTGYLDFNPPAAVSGLAGTPTATSIDLSWTEPADTDIAEYRVKLDGSTVATVAAPATGVTVSGLTASTSYDVQVVAVDTGGNQTASSTITVITLSAALAEETDALVEAGELTPDGILVTGETVHLNDYVTDENVILVDTHLVISGSFEARSLLLTRGSTITHPVRAGLEAEPLWLSAETIEIDATSAVALDGRGVAEQGAFHAVHGGLAAGEPETMVYGSPVYPTRPGRGEAGGGAVILESRTLVLNGLVTARGKGFASGGSVLILTDHLLGGGTIDVSGGNGSQGIGGGGRVAVHAAFRHRFHGVVITGLEEAVRGTVVMSMPDEDTLWLGNAWPMTKETVSVTMPQTLPLLDGHIVKVLENNRGSVLRLKWNGNAHNMIGAWLQWGDQRYRVREALSLDDGEWLIQLNRTFDRFDSETGRFILLLANPDQVRGNPAGMPLLPGR
ncbi:MAG: carboxypeptidase regulatory-like domain-containing protein [Acidobacteriota bacterium]|nr:carboxypeptidase regulatory-like domain-containing protein [Acidobacteriota bacterium]